MLRRLMRLRQWFERFVNQWCLINDQEMHFAHWSIFLDNFGPSNCILNLLFQILTPPGSNSNSPVDFDFPVFVVILITQKTGYLSAFRRKIKIANYYFGSEKTGIEYTYNVSFLFSIYSNAYANVTRRLIG